MLIQLVIIEYYVAVIIGVSDPYPAVIIYLNVVISVSDVKLLESAVCFNAPVDLSVFLTDRKYSCYMRNKVIIVKTVFHDIARLTVQIVQRADKRNFLTLFVQKGDVAIRT